MAAAKSEHLASPAAGGPPSVSASPSISASLSTLAVSMPPAVMAGLALDDLYADAAGVGTPAGTPLPRPNVAQSAMATPLSTPLPGSQPTMRRTQSGTIVHVKLSPALSVVVPGREKNSTFAGSADQDVRRMGSQRRRRTVADRNAMALSFLKSIQIDRRPHSIDTLTWRNSAAGHVAIADVLNQPDALGDSRKAPLRMRELLGARPLAELSQYLVNCHVVLCLSSAATVETAPPSAASSPLASPRGTPRIPSAQGGAVLHSNPIAVFSVLSRTFEPAGRLNAGSSTENLEVESVSALVVRQRRTICYAAKLEAAEEGRPVPKLIDDTVRTEKIVHVLPSLVVSVLPYVSPKDLRAQLNEQFHLRHQSLHESLTLSRIRALKVSMASVTVRAGLEPATLAYAFVYLESLLFRNKIDSAASLPIIGACALSLAHKFNGNLSVPVALDAAIGEILLVSREHRRRAEFRVFGMLDFGLHVAHQVVMVHYERIAKSLGVASVSANMENHSIGMALELSSECDSSS